MTKRKSFISFVTTFCLMLSTLFVFTACGEEEHQHKFSTKWSADATYHWHAAECDDTDEVKDKELHQAGVWRSDNAQHWKVCPTCDYEVSARVNHEFVNFVCQCGAISQEATMLVISNGTAAYYDSFSTESLAALSVDSQVTLLKDITIEKYISINKTVSIDFNGHTVTATQSGGFDVKEDNTVTDAVILTLSNGTLDTYKWGAWVENGGQLVVASDFTILANRANLTTANAVTIVGEGSQLDFYGTAIVTGKTNCISGHGNIENGGIIVNINDGAVIEGGENGIYLPNSRALNIGKASITAETALYLRSGTTTINGAKITATGEKKEYVYVDGQQYSTGDAIIMDSVGYPGGAPTIILLDATIASENGSAFVVYKVNGNDASITNNTDYTAEIHEVNA